MSLAHGQSRQPAVRARRLHMGVMRDARMAGARPVGSLRTAVAVALGRPQRFEFDCLVRADGADPGEGDCGSLRRREPMGGMIRSTIITVRVPQAIRYRVGQKPVVAPEGSACRRAEAHAGRPIPGKGSRQGTPAEAAVGTGLLHFAR